MSKKLKKLGGLCIAFNITFGLIANCNVMNTYAYTSGAVANGNYENDDFKYSVKDNKVTITSYKKNEDKVSIPSTINDMKVVQINDSAFNGKNLSNLSIPNTVEAIIDYAFVNCKNLTTVTIPASVSTIGEKAFSNEYINEIKVSASNKNYCAVDGNLFNKDKSKLIMFTNKIATSYVLPTTVKSLSRGCFKYSKSLQNVTLNSSITEIPEYAFYNCNELSSIVMNNNITSIGESAFERCFKLTNVILPSKIKSLGKTCFSGAGLTSINLPEGLLTIDSLAFSGTKISTISIPSSVTSIGSELGFSTSTLKSIKVNANNKNYCDIDGVLFSKDKSILIAYPSFKSSKYVIPNTVKKIGSYAFYSNNQLTDITIGTSVNVIDEKAFSYCNELTKVIIPSCVKNINSNAFHGCYKITNLSLAKGLVNIGDGAFSLCTGLNDVVIPSTVKNIGKSAFMTSGIKNITFNSDDCVISDNILAYCYATIYCHNNSTALKYAKDKNINYKIIDEEKPLVINSFNTSISSPQTIGSTVTLSASATGEGRLLYRFTTWLNGKKINSSSTSTKNNCVWTPSKAGNYILKVEVKDEAGKIITKTMQYTITEKSKIQITSLTTNLVSPQKAGMPIDVTAKFIDYDNSKIKFLYFTVWLNGKRVDSSDLRNVGNVWRWRPTSEGNYIIKVNIVDANNNTASKKINYVVSGQSQINISKIAFDPTSPQNCNESINIRVSASGKGQLKYRYTISCFGLAKPRTIYSQKYLYCWRPVVKGIYTIKVDVIDETNKVVTKSERFEIV